MTLIAVLYLLLWPDELNLTYTCRQILCESPQTHQTASNVCDLMAHITGSKRQQQGKCVRRLNHRSPPPPQRNLILECECVITVRFWFLSVSLSFSMNSAKTWKGCLVTATASDDDMHSAHTPSKSDETYQTPPATPFDGTRSVASKFQSNSAGPRK